MSEREDQIAKRGKSPKRESCIYRIVFSFLCLLCLFFSSSSSLLSSNFTQYKLDVLFFFFLFCIVLISLHFEKDCNFFYCAFSHVFYPNQLQFVTVYIKAEFLGLGFAIEFCCGYLCLIGIWMCILSLAVCGCFCRYVICV